MNQKKMTSMMLALMMLALVVGCTQSPSAQVVKSDDVLRVGVLSPLSGDAAPWGTPVAEGVEYALRDVENKKVFFADSKCDPTTGITAARMLIDNYDVDVIIGAVCSSVTLAVAPIAEEANVVLISPASTSPLVSDAGEYVYRVIPSDDLRGKVFAQYLYREGYHTVAAAYINNDGGQGGYLAFKGEFERLGGTIAAVEPYAAGTTDFKTQLLKLDAAQGDAILIFSYVKDSALIMQQAKEFAVVTKMFFPTEAISDPAVQTIIKENDLSTTYIVPATTAGDLVDAFNQGFEERFGHEPGFFAPEAYDAASLIDQQAIGCFKPIGRCLKGRLDAVVGYRGIAGDITFDEHGDVAKPMVIKEVSAAGEKVLATI